MPVRAEAFLSPKSAQNSASTTFRQRQECLYRSAHAVSSASHIPKHILPALSAPFLRYSLGFLSNTVTFQNT